MDHIFQISFRQFYEIGPTHRHLTANTGSPEKWHRIYSCHSYIYVSIILSIFQARPPIGPGLIEASRPVTWPLQSEVQWQPPRARKRGHPKHQTSLSFRPYSMQGLPGVLWKLLLQIGVGQRQLPRIPSPAPLLQWPPPPPIKTIRITCAVYPTLSPHERLAFTQLRGRLVHNMPYAV